MAGPCHADFQRLATELGEFACQDQNLLVNLHNPLGLDHWTMLLFEVATFVGAILTLRHAIRRRRAGDPTTLAIWIAAIAYLVIVEPPLYFPANFGLQEQTGLIFVHNEFTVQFLWNRLPLYIVSIYPVLAVLSFEAVRLTGVMAKRGIWTSALTVGFFYHVIYEVFDQVGPQLRWWIWNPTAPSNEPFLASVPISSMVNFAAIGPVVLTVLVLWFVGRRPDAATMSTGRLFGRGAVAGLLMPLGLIIGGMPATVFTFAEETNRTGQAIAYWLTLAVITAVAVHALLEAYRDRAQIADEASRRYLTTHASIYLGALVISWGAAMPEYFGATEGITASGTPIGSLPYAIACMALALAVLGVALVRREAPTGASVEVAQPAVVV